MEDTYENIDVFKWTNYNSPTEPETEDDIHVNAEQHSITKKPTALSFDYKIVIYALGLLLLGALTSLCAVGILYHYKVISIEIISEKYGNATATLMMLGNKANARNCQPCEKVWKALGLKCCYFSTEKLSWTESRDHCVKKGGHLVIITSQTEQNFASSQIKVTHWIGLNDLETEGTWMWVNNQPLKETGLTFWFSAPEGPNEPDNWKKEDPSGENCASLGHEKGNTNKWFDASCRKLKHFICEN